MVAFIADYYFDFILGLTTLGIGYLFSSVKRLFKKQVAVETGVQALLRNEIVRIYDNSTEAKWIPIHVLDNVMLMYVEYKNLGGNGMVKELMEKLKRLPTSQSSVAETTTTVTTTLV